MDLKGSVIGVIAGLVLVGCGGGAGGLSGEYGVEGGDVILNFKSGGELEVNTAGTIAIAQYEVKDGKVYITRKGATNAYPINAQGCIEGGMTLGVMCKKS